MSISGGSVDRSGDRSGGGRDHGQGNGVGAGRNHIEKKKQPIALLPCRQMIITRKKNDARQSEPEHSGSINNAREGHVVQ